jgi:hypothetical protein
MIVGLVLAATVGSSQIDIDRKLDSALGELAYTVGACARALPKQAADPVVLSLTGADINDPSDWQKRNRKIFSGLFIEGRDSPGARALTITDCTKMLGDLTVELHKAANGQDEL